MTDIDPAAITQALGPIVAELDDADVMALFLDVAWEHRSEVVKRGFSPEAAETMAVTLHSGLIARYFTS